MYINTKCVLILTQVLSVLVRVGDLEPLVLHLLGVVHELKSLPGPRAQLTQMVQQAQGHVVVGQGAVVFPLHLGEGSFK